MESKAVKDLVGSVSRALHEGDLERAREICAQLEATSPNDAGLPRQRAEISRMMGDRDDELAALIRAAELYGDAGQIIQAIGVPAERFRGLAERHPELRAALTKLAQQRQRQNHAALRNASDLRDDNLGTV